MASCARLQTKALCKRDEKEECAQHLVAYCMSFCILYYCLLACHARATRCAPEDLKRRLQLHTQNGV